jgi:hypothetical protein
MRFVQGYQFAFDPRNGLDALSAGVKPVSAGLLPVVPLSTGSAQSPFLLGVEECHAANGTVFGSWPPMKPSTGYFVVLALTSPNGRFDGIFEGTIASTTN